MLPLQRGLLADNVYSVRPHVCHIGTFIAIHTTKGMIIECNVTSVFAPPPSQQRA